MPTPVSPSAPDGCLPEVNRFFKALFCAAGRRRKLRIVRSDRKAAELIHSAAPPFQKHSRSSRCGPRRQLRSLLSGYVFEFLGRKESQRALANVPPGPPKTSSVSGLNQCLSEWVSAPPSAPHRFAPALRGRYVLWLARRAPCPHGAVCVPGQMREKHANPGFTFCSGRAVIQG